MASYQDNLITTRNNIAAQLAAISANPKPSYSSEGKSVSWADYFQMLTNQLATLNQQILVAEGPFEIRTQGTT